MKSHLVIVMLFCLCSALFAHAHEDATIVELEGTLSNQTIDRIDLPAGFTRDNTLLLAAWVEETLPAQLCGSGNSCKFRQNFLTNLRSDDLMMPTSFGGASWGARMATLSLDEDTVVIYHSALETVRPSRGAITISSQQVPVLVNLPYKIVLKRYK